MPLQARTREQIETAIGYNLGMEVVEADAGGTTTTFLTDDIFSAANDQNGKWLEFTSGANNRGEVRRVTASTIASDRTTLTFAPAVPDATASPDTALLWPVSYRPEAIREFINNTILEATGKVFDTEESLALHTDGKNIRFALPAVFAMVHSVYYRSSFPSKLLSAADAVWTTSTDADITQLADTEDRRKGGASQRLTIAAGASANDFIGQDISSTNLRNMTHLELWIKSSVATAAADLHILLDDTAGGGSAVETLEVPALAAATWTFVRIALANPQLDGAIVNIRFRYTADIGAVVVWLNDIRAVNNNESVWVKIPSRLWHIDRSARDLVFTEDGRSVAGYALLKIVGGDNPVLLTAATTVSEIDDEFIIARATEMALLSNARGPETDLDGRLQRAAYWRGIADRARHKFPFLVGAKIVT